MYMIEKSMKTCFIFSNLSGKSRGYGSSLTSDVHFRLTHQYLSPHPTQLPSADPASTFSSPFLPPPPYSVSHPD